MALDVVTTANFSGSSVDIATIKVEATKNVQAVALVNASGTPIASSTPAYVTLDTAIDSSIDSIGQDYPTAQVWKSYNSTSSIGAGSAATVWAPASGKKIRVTSCTISTYGTTSARIFLFFADTADNTYSAGTDQPLFVGSFSPSSTVKPGAHLKFDPPLKCENADYILKYQNDAAISIDVTAYGFEE